MSTYKTNLSGFPIQLVVEVASPAPARSYVEIDSVEIIKSPDFSGGSILETPIGSNAQLQSKTLKITTIIDLSPLTDDEKALALNMIKTAYTLNGGPDGLQLFWLLKTKWIQIDDDIFINKYIDLIP
tara:strand:- start:23131 stop:23511 length:381 start_codon:yes stop_codon:yes gene_type:complete